MQAEVLLLGQRVGQLASELDEHRESRWAGGGQGKEKCRGGKVQV